MKQIENILGRNKPARTFFLLYVIAMFAAGPDPKGIIIFWMFPLGLFKFVNIANWDNYKFIAIIIGYAIYGVILYFMLSARHVKSFYTWVIILILILLLNIAGCRAILAGFSSVT